MKMKSMLCALLVAAATCLAFPVIAQPPDSPPKAQPAKEVPNASDLDLVFRPLDVFVPAVLDLQRMPLAVSEDAILTAGYVAPIDLGQYRRLLDLRPRFRVTPVGIRPMSPSPPGFI
jgi:hypothetical protein